MIILVRVREFQAAIFFLPSVLAPWSHSRVFAGFSCALTGFARAAVGDGHVLWSAVRAACRAADTAACVVLVAIFENRTPKWESKPGAFVLIPPKLDDSRSRPATKAAAKNRRLHGPQVDNLFGKNR